MGERFNGLMWNLLEAGATDFVETGTLVAGTSGAIARDFDVPVWTCEIDPKFIRRAGERLSRYPQAHFYEMPSQEFLPLVIPELGNLPLFFLDAHGPGHCPLRDELRIITGECEKAAVIVHDFKVPGRGMSEFRYDYYDGAACDFDYVLPALAAGRGYRFFVPAYAPPEGQRYTGYVLIFQDVEPFGDLGNLVEWKGR